MDAAKSDRDNSVGTSAGNGVGGADGGDAEHVRRLVALRPEIAASLGAPTGHDRLPDGDPAARGAVLDALVTWRSALEPQGEEPDPQRGLDARVFAASLELFRFTEQKLALHERDPDVAGPLFEALLVQLRRDARDEEGAVALAGRLAATPKYLAAARAVVKSPDPLLLERARDVAVGCAAVTKAVLDDARERAQAGQLPRAAADAVQHAAQQAAAAVDEHRRWLAALAPAAAQPLGKDALDEIMRLRGLDLTAAEVLDLGKSIAEEMRIEERRLVRRAFKGLTGDTALAAARKTTPESQAECLSWLTELIDQSRPFLEETGSIPVPTAAGPALSPDGDEGVVAMAAPGSLFVDGGAAHFIPAAARPGRQQSIVFIDEATVGAYAEMSVADLEALVAREAYPGSHLMAVTANRAVRPARRGVPTGFLAGVAATWGHDMKAGWALYAEELMRELQFRDSPASKLVAVRNGLQAALLAVVDVCLGLGRFSAEEAAAFLTRRGGVPGASARAQVRAMRRTPTAAVSALVGKVRIEQLRREARKRWRQAYNDKRFHGLLLRSGPIPLAYLFEMLDQPEASYASQGRTEDISIEDGVIVRRE